MQTTKNNNNNNKSTTHSRVDKSAKEPSEQFIFLVKRTIQSYSPKNNSYPNQENNSES